MTINFHLNFSFFYECHLFSHADAIKNCVFNEKKNCNKKNIKSILKVVAHTYNPNI